MVIGRDGHARQVVLLLGLVLLLLLLLLVSASIASGVVRGHRYVLLRQLLQHVVGTAIAVYDRTAVAATAVATAITAASGAAANAVAVVAAKVVMMDVCRRWIWRCRVGRTRR